MNEENQIHNYLNSIGYTWVDWDVPSGGSLFHSDEEDKTIMVLVEEIKNENRSN